DLGLPMSQPEPLPYLAIRPEKVRMPVTCTIWNSSARDCSKCSHSALDISTPDCSSSFLSIGTQPPQEVPAVVQLLMPAMSQAPSAMAPQIEPLETLLQEQICASSGSASAPSSAPAGEISAAGSAGSGRPT